jgi:hypothetical protein
MDYILTNLIPMIAQNIAVTTAISTLLQRSAREWIAKYGYDLVEGMSRYLARSVPFKNVARIAQEGVMTSKIYAAKLTKQLLAGTITLYDALKMGARLGKTGLRKVLVDAGYNEATIERKLASVEMADVEQFATRIAAKLPVAEVAAKSALTRIAGGAIAFVAENPLSVAYDAMTIAGVILDATGNFGNFKEYVSTDDLLTAKASFDTKQANDIFLANSIKYPSVVGPLDTMQFDDSVDLNSIILYRMTQLLVRGSDDSSTLNPVIRNIITSMYNRHIYTRGQNPTDVDFAFAMQSLSTSQLTQLYQIVIDQLCVEKGGITFDPGVPGWSNLCTFSSMSNCHSSSVWSFGKGIATNPKQKCSSSGSGGCPEWDGAYYEWRAQNYFNTIPINLSGDPVTHHVAAPPGGACIAQSPLFHLGCDQITCVSGNEFSGGAGCAVNQYRRDTGVCYNDVPAMCDLYAVDQKGDGPRDPMGNQYPTCYESEATTVAEDAFPGGPTLYRANYSCVTGASCGGRAAGWLNLTDCYQDPYNGWRPKGVFARKSPHTWGPNVHELESSAQDKYTNPANQVNTLGDRGSCEGYSWQT